MGMHIPISQHAFFEDVLFSRRGPRRSVIFNSLHAFLPDQGELGYSKKKQHVEIIL